MRKAKDHLSAPQSGFTLVEVALIVMVMGLLLVPFFQFLAVQSKKKSRVDQTAQHELITAAMSRYFSENGVYPCPANPELGPSDPGFGVAQTCGAIAAGSCSPSPENICAFSEPAPGVGVAYSGALPVADLRLPSEAIVNAFGWKYLYTVSGGVTVAPVTGGVLDVWVDNDDLGIRGTTGLDNVGNPLDVSDFNYDSLPFVIVDTGADGKGSRSLEGTLSPFDCRSSPTAGDYNNCRMTAEGLASLPSSDFVEFRDLNYSAQDNVNLATHYDDILLYSLVQKDSTVWRIDDDDFDTDGVVHITTRGDGNVGVGMAGESPRAKLHIKGGDARFLGGAGGPALNARNIELLSEESMVDGNIITSSPVGTDAGGFHYAN